MRHYIRRYSSNTFLGNEAYNMGCNIWVMYPTTYGYSQYCSEVERPPMRCVGNGASSDQVVIAPTQMNGAGRKAGSVGTPRGVLYKGEGENQVC